MPGIERSIRRLVPELLDWSWGIRVRALRVVEPQLGCISSAGTDVT